jgi:hypothetical protein
MAASNDIAGILGVEREEGKQGYQSFDVEISPEIGC